MLHQGFGLGGGCGGYTSDPLSWPGACDGRLQQPQIGHRGAVPTARSAMRQPPHSDCQALHRLASDLGDQLEALVDVQHGQLTQFGHGRDQQICQ